MRYGDIELRKFAHRTRAKLLGSLKPAHKILWEIARDLEFIIASISIVRRTSEPKNASLR